MTATIYSTRESAANHLTNLLANDCAVYNIDIVPQGELAPHRAYTDLTSAGSTLN